MPFSRASEDQTSVDGFIATNPPGSIEQYAEIFQEYLLTTEKACCGPLANAITTTSLPVYKACSVVPGTRPSRLLFLGHLRKTLSMRSDPPGVYAASLMSRAHADESITPPSRLDLSSRTSDLVLHKCTRAVSIGDYTCSIISVLLLLLSFCSAHSNVELICFQKKYGHQLLSCVSDCGRIRL